MEEERKPMKLAFHSYAFGGRSWLPAWTLEEALRLTAEMGFDGLELAACRPHAWPADLSRARRRALRQLASDYGLAFSAICPTAVNHNIASHLAEERIGTVRYLVECLDLAVDLGCGVVVANGGWSVKPHARTEAWCWAREGLTAAASEAQDRNVILALENINGQRADVVVLGRDTADMVAEVDSPALKPMIDFYHLHLENEDPLETIECLGPDLAYTHFLDARRADRARRAPGLGEMSLVPILSALHEVGYGGWLGVEIWGDDPIALGRQAVAFWREYQSLPS
jgi:protein FrlC